MGWKRFKKQHVNNGMKGMKAQAALEYLMTYGWAILIVIAVIGLLTYIVMKAQIIAPEKCEIPIPFTCKLGGYTIDTNGEMRIIIENKGPTAVAINITKTRCCEGCDIEDIADVFIPAGREGNVTFDCVLSRNFIGKNKTGELFTADDIIIWYFPTEAGSGFAKVMPLSIGVRFR